MNRQTFLWILVGGLAAAPLVAETRPGGNLTGLTNLCPSICLQWLAEMWRLAYAPS
jgi:hypothetical protein